MKIDKSCFVSNAWNKKSESDFLSRWLIFPVQMWSIYDTLKKGNHEYSYINSTQADIDIAFAQCVESEIISHIKRECGGNLTSIITSQMINNIIHSGETHKLLIFFIYTIYKIDKIRDIVKKGSENINYFMCLCDLHISKIDIMFLLNESYPVQLITGINNFCFYYMTNYFR